MTTLPTRDAMTGNAPVVIKAKHVYIDLVHARFKRRLRTNDLAFLKSNCGGSIKYESDKLLPGWRYRLVLNQPNDRALQYLHDKFGKDVLINRIESTVDLVTEDTQSADLLKRSIERHLVQKNRRARLLGSAGTTAYWRDRRWVSRQPVTYVAADGSKVAKGAPCARVEIRVCGARAVRRVGVHRFSDLIGLDHRSLWQRVVYFAAIDLAGLGRAKRYAEGDKRRRLPDLDFDARTGRAMALAARQFDTNGNPRRDNLTVQEIIDRYRDELDLRTALVPLDHDWLLPDPPP